MKGSHYDSLSDSEIDDTWKAVLQSRTKLNEVKHRVRNLEEDDQFTKNTEELVLINFAFSGSFCKLILHIFFRRYWKKSATRTLTAFWSCLTKAELRTALLCSRGPKGLSKVDKFVQNIPLNYFLKSLFFIFRFTETMARNLADDCQTSATFWIVQ